MRQDFVLMESIESCRTGLCSRIGIDVISTIRMCQLPASCRVIPTQTLMFVPFSIRHLRFWNHNVFVLFFSALCPGIVGKSPHFLASGRWMERKPLFRCLLGFNRLDDLYHNVAYVLLLSHCDFLEAALNTFAVNIAENKGWNKRRWEDEKTNHHLFVGYGACSLANIHPMVVRHMEERGKHILAHFACLSFSGNGVCVDGRRNPLAHGQLCHEPRWNRHSRYRLEGGVGVSSPEWYKILFTKLYYHWRDMPHCGIIGVLYLK